LRAKFTGAKLTDANLNKSDLKKRIAGAGEARTCDAL
jgi:uncharacterized protein YjbI with pentapeptide repeats